MFNKIGVVVIIIIKKMMMMCGGVGECIPFNSAQVQIHILHKHTSYTPSYI